MKFNHEYLLLSIHLALNCVIALLLTFFSHSASLDVFVILCGALLAGLNLKFFSLLTHAILGQALGVASFTVLSIGKTVVVLTVLIYGASLGPDRFISLTVGFLTFIPSALIYAIIIQAERSEKTDN